MHIPGLMCMSSPLLLQTCRVKARKVCHCGPRCRRKASLPHPSSSPAWQHSLPPARWKFHFRFDVMAQVLLPHQGVLCCAHKIMQTWHLDLCWHSALYCTVFVTLYIQCFVYRTMYIIVIKHDYIARMSFCLLMHSYDRGRGGYGTGSGCGWAGQDSCG